MTDYEMVKHCAEALGLGYIRPCEESECAVEYNEDPQEQAWMVFTPLDSDMDAMTLLKTFDIVVEREKDKTFGVTLFGNKYRGGKPTFVVRNCADLNRALVHCVAHFQASKPSSGDSRGIK